MNLMVSSTEGKLYASDEEQHRREALYVVASDDEQNRREDLHML